MIIRGKVESRLAFGLRPNKGFNHDLAPTLLDVVGIGISQHMQGRSLKPILASDAAPGQSSFLYEHFPVFPIPGIEAVRTDKYKYIEYQNHVRPRESYDLQKDPGERVKIRVHRARLLGRPHRGPCNNQVL